MTGTRCATCDRPLALCECTPLAGYTDCAADPAHSPDAIARLRGPAFVLLTSLFALLFLWLGCLLARLLWRV